MPLLAVVFYFSKAPRYIPFIVVKAKVMALIILTIILPILLFLLLKTLKKVNSSHLETTRERILPLLLNCGIIILILQRILPINEYEELYFFFIGVLISTLSCLILAIFKLKASIHMIASAGVWTFFIALSIHFSINIIGTLGLFSLILGAIATSRLHLNAHTNAELLMGFFIGSIPQLIALNYWL